jgi:nucleoside-diphosphate-sugar epimerase
MKILVTGGLGFLGVHLVRGLAELMPEAQITAGDVLKASPPILDFLSPVKNRVEIVSLDVRHRQAFRSMVQSLEIDTIVHAAALTPDGEIERVCMEDVLDVNLGGALNAILAAREETVKQVLLCSSSGLYGAPGIGQHQPQAEEAAVELNNLYTITKYSAELLGQRCALLSGKRFAAVRLTSLYGEMERPTGSREQMSLVFRLMDALFKGRKVRLAGAEIGRDWMHAGEVAAAVKGLLGAPTWNYSVYNIGSGQVLKLGELVKIFEAYGLDVEWMQDPARADIGLRSENGRAALNIERLTADTGFLPANSRQKMEEFVSARTLHPFQFHAR